MTDDFFRARLDAMIVPKYALAVLALRLPWRQIEQGIAPCSARKARPEQLQMDEDLFGATAQWAGGGVSNAGRSRLPLRLMIALTLLKNSFDLSDEELVQRFAENVYYQYFAGYEYFDPTVPCDTTQMGRFRSALGETGLEELLQATLQTALDIGAVRKSEFERVIVDTTVQEKAIAHPVDSRLLEIARRKVVVAAKRCGIVLKQTFAAEGKTLQRQAGGYAHAKQFKRLKRVVKRPRTILGILVREARRKMASTADNALALNSLNTWLERAERVRNQQRHDKNKLYALHAPEVEYIGKGKARKPYEFGVKVSVAITHKQGLIVGARSFPGNPWDGHTLAEQIEQSTILLEDIGVKPRQVVVDLGYRGKEVDAANPGVDIIHRGRSKTMSKHERKLLKRRQAVEPAIGHLKADHRMNRCWLKGSMGDALHALSCALGYNLRWLIRALVRLSLTGFLLALLLTRWTASLATRYVLHEPQTAHANMMQA
ncbi:IS5 family transposase [Polaromonas sp. C04]|uniref:IS5 family transposase n=1 Tax=Polaromonas sp. C04 TaxID=1945857 RepID=UPI0009CB02BD|nr:IS5 family transposase [Polaromonas sp. C04]